MRKTSVHLTDEEALTDAEALTDVEALTAAEAEGLRRLVVREGRAQAERSREGVRRVSAEIETQARTFRSLGARPERGRRAKGCPVDLARALSQGDGRSVVAPKLPADQCGDVW